MHPRWIALAFVLLLPWRVASQPLTSFPDLTLRLDHGDHVVVETMDGAPVAAAVVALTPDSLTVRVAGDGERTFTATEVRRVVRRGDSLSNGFRWGLAAGAVLGCLSAVGFVDGGTWHDCPTGAIVLSAPFVGIAVVIDAAHVGSTEIYRAAPSRAGAPLRGGRLAAALVWRW
jgi:hypothetical protein